MSTIKQIAARLKELHPDGVNIRSRSEFEKLVRETYSTTGDILAEQVGTPETLAIAEFGRFSIKHMEARTAKNPRNGNLVHVPPRERPKFVPGKELKDKLQAAADRRGDQHAGR